MKIAIAQIDPVVGAFEANLKKISDSYQRACAEQARLLLTPEMSVCGYPPHDLLDRPEMIVRNEKILEKIAEMTRGQKCAIAVGHVSANPSATGRTSQNSVSVFENGKCIFKQSKSLLPTYDVFDEARYFEPGQVNETLTLDGVKIAFAICEDLWAHDPVLERKLYAVDPVEKYKKLAPQLLVSCSASPYEFGKCERRESIHKDIAKTLKIPLIYVNQTGATDEILFDGASFIANPKGELEYRLPYFEVAHHFIELDEKLNLKSKGLENTSAQKKDIEILALGLVAGIREYFLRSGFKKAVIGLSGGIDSAVVGALAARAIGGGNILGVAMPSQYSSSHSLEDAEILAKNLAMPLEVQPIKFLFSTANRQLAERRGELAPLALENLQSRLRGLTLMTLANHYSALVLTTGNKSELATGYCTLYGDMAGAIGAIGDLFKTRVYELARFINDHWGAPIPERSITKAPSAELKPNQTDQDTLPPYHLLDELLELYLEKATPLAQITEVMAPKGLKEGLKEGWIQSTLDRIELNEYKRRQAAPVLKVSRKAFGVGRRIPIAKIWDQK